MPKESFKYSFPAKSNMNCYYCQKGVVSIENTIKYVYLHVLHVLFFRFIERKKRANMESLAAPIKIKFPKVVIKKEFIKQVPGAPSPEPR